MFTRGTQAFAAGYRHKTGTCVHTLQVPRLSLCTPLVHLTQTVRHRSAFMGVTCTDMQKT